MMGNAADPPLWVVSRAGSRASLKGQPNTSPTSPGEEGRPIARPTSLSEDSGGAGSRSPRVCGSLGETTLCGCPKGACHLRRWVRPSMDMKTAQVVTKELARELDWATVRESAKLTGLAAVKFASWWLCGRGLHIWEPGNMKTARCRGVCLLRDAVRRRESSRLTLLRLSSVGGLGHALARAAAHRLQARREARV